MWYLNPANIRELVYNEYLFVYLFIYFSKVKSKMNVVFKSGLTNIRECG